MKNKTWVEISKDALLGNVGQFLSLLPRDVQFMAVVKSNAYGHGLVQVVSSLRDAPSLRDRAIWFGIDNLDEARVVRKIAPKNPVLVLGYTQNERLREAVKLGARITVYNWETISALKTLCGRNATIVANLPHHIQLLQVHVKVETGTTRQGIAEDEAVDFIKALKKLRGVAVEGISTHFADSEDLESDYALKQLARYNSVIKRLETAKIAIPVHHTACTAATLRYPQSHGNLVRVGLGMYGLWASQEVKLKMQNVKCKIDLKPVLSWKTIVAQVKEVAKGTPISYDQTELVTRNSRVAVIPVGYWDGYDRGLSRIGEVLINGKRCKVLGRVCMNMMMVDITDAENIKPENEVVLLGTQDRAEVKADDIAKKLGTINYEVATRINPAIPRIIMK